MNMYIGQVYLDSRDIKPCYQRSANRMDLMNSQVYYYIDCKYKLSYQRLSKHSKAHEYERHWESILLHK